MPSPLRIRERLSSFFKPNLDNIQRIAEEDLKVMVTEFQPLEITKAEVSPPPIPTDLSSRQFPQKELVAGVEALLPEILEESKKYGSVVQIFIAIAFIKTIEDTPAKFFFTLESREEANTIILEWAKAYQDQNLMLPALMATVHWGFTPITW